MSSALTKVSRGGWTRLYIPSTNSSSDPVASAACPCSMKSTPQSKRVFKSSRAESSCSPLHRTCDYLSPSVVIIIQIKTIFTFLFSFRSGQSSLQAGHSHENQYLQVKLMILGGCSKYIYKDFLMRPVSSLRFNLPRFQFSLSLLFRFEVENLAVVFTHLKQKKGT